MTDDNLSSIPTITLRVEHSHDAFGIGTDQPRLSWIVDTNGKHWQQGGYEIELYGNDGRLREQTGEINSQQSVLVNWPFPPLLSRERVQVRVRARNVERQISAWSDLVFIETGLLKVEDWSAQFVGPDWIDDLSQPQPSPLLRREFDVRSGVQRARLYITSLGVYEAQLNGVVIGDQVMTPGWTSYKHRLRYQTYDVSGMLNEGRNALGVMLGDGWFRGRLGFGGGRRNIYGDRLAILAQLEIVYTDGTVQTVISDDASAWRAAIGPIVASDIYDGEIYDARLEQDGWSKPAFDDSSWTSVRLIDWDLSTLTAPVGAPVRRIEIVSAVSIFKSPSGHTLIDFGQNLVGRLRLTVQGSAGHTITVRHAEVLEHGELGTRPLRTAKATDVYILRGDRVEIWEPRFTFHGFRYVEVENWPGELTTKDIRAVVCHSDLERTGWFECSDPLINRLHENIVWSMRGNFLDLPTDCPQRDERLGWTGDIQVFSPAASYLYDTYGFLASWLQDLAAEQNEYHGVVPPVVPNVIPGPPIGAAVWGDAAVIVPWVLYQRFGDRSILENQFASMCAWVDWIEQQAGETLLWDKGFQYGDWLDPFAPPDRPADARTRPYIVATAYFARSAELVGRSAGILGLVAKQEHYLSLAKKIRSSFAREYVTPSGRLVNDAQTAYTLALEFGLLPEAEQQQHAAERLSELVRENGYHIGTGFVGTPLICDALCNGGYHAIAYRLLLQRECPSWLYPVTMGATTIWERWDSMLPDGSINPGEMTSFNHYALGAVGDWLHRTVGGITPAEPGYRSLIIRPQPGGGLTAASTRHMTPYGMAECKWNIQDRSMHIKAVIPPNTTAQIMFPGTDSTTTVESGTYDWSYEYKNLDG